MSNGELKDPHGRLLGRIRQVGQVLELRDAHGHLLGRYDPRSDTTRDPHGRVIGRGNLLTSLL